MRALRQFGNYNHRDLWGCLDWLSDHGFAEICDEDDGLRRIVLREPPPLCFEPVRTFRGNQLGIAVVRCANVVGVPLPLLMTESEQRKFTQLVSTSDLTPADHSNCRAAYQSLRSLEGSFFMHELDAMLKGKRAAKRALKLLKDMGLVEWRKEATLVLTVFSPAFVNVARDLKVDLLAEATDAGTAAADEAADSPAAELLDLYTAILTAQGHPVSAISRLKLMPVAQRLVADGSFVTIRPALCGFLLDPQSFAGHIGQQLDHYGATLLTFERNLDTILYECKRMAAPYRNNPDEWWKRPMRSAGLERWCN